MPQLAQSSKQKGQFKGDLILEISRTANKSTQSGAIRRPQQGRTIIQNHLDWHGFQ